jgi:hypothetical protein
MCESVFELLIEEFLSQRASLEAEYREELEEMRRRELS